MKVTDNKLEMNIKKKLIYGEADQNLERNFEKWQKKIASIIKNRIRRGYDFLSTA